MRKGILLVNLGTPDSQAVGDVRKYLAEFLMDKRVIDIHPFLRFLLVRGLIIPFRAPKSARLYRGIWNDRTGSPLLHFSNLQLQLLKLELGDDYVIELGMRYQYPSIELALHKLKSAGVQSIVVIPLFPQYASATTGSVIAEVMRVMRRWPTILPLAVRGAFYDHPLFIDAFTEKIQRYNRGSYDHILFSFHGLPERQLRACDPSGTYCLAQKNCCAVLTEINRNCYAAQCHETARLIAAELKLTRADYCVCFQSRLGKQEWIKPHTSTTIRQLAASGKRRLLVVCPAFVSDCLETLQEIAVEYRQEFIAAGGEELLLVESLNESPLFIRALQEMATGIAVHPLV
ncbi:ferrochelatase [Mucilaginibacter sp. HC2]|uniref:ferrochelatase n=1 Tax=Mucilaginibacter inviolabilis TaxID=2714892 RepID=UPI00140E1A48|nr:ferrochelatase [Mucilaginibacter inviolabilis]NHA03343.1 ferrochelatase [Mucilaginibacter inviolabilis]